MSKQVVNIAASMIATPTRDIETITGEVLALKDQAGAAILDIGRRLNEAKELLSHGEWLPWLRDRVEISEKMAQNFMRLSREYPNPQPVADLGARKALSLLALESEDREAFLAENDVTDMTARELEQAIRERKEALAEKEKALADKRVAEQSSAKMAEDVAMLNKELEELRNRPIEVTGASVPDEALLEATRQEATREVQAKLERVQKAKEKAEEKQKQAEEALAAAEFRLAQAAKQDKAAVIAADKDMATFEVLFSQGQDIANRMGGILMKLNNRGEEEKSAAVKKAILALADAIRRVGE